MLKAKHTYKMPNRHKVEVLIAFLIGLGPWIYGLYELNIGNPMPGWIYGWGLVLTVIGLGLGTIQVIGGIKVRKNSTLFAEANSDNILSVWMAKPGLVWKNKVDFGTNKIDLNEVDSARVDSIAGQEVLFLGSNQKNYSSSITIPKRIATTVELSSYLENFFNKNSSKLKGEEIEIIKEFIKK